MLKGGDEWEERDDCSFMCRVTLVRACERERLPNDAIVSLCLLTHLVSFVPRSKCFCLLQSLKCTCVKLTRSCWFTHLYRAKSVRDVDSETKTNPELRRRNHITQNMASSDYFSNSVWKSSFSLMSVLCFYFAFSVG